MRQILILLTVISYRACEPKDSNEGTPANYTHFKVVSKDGLNLRQAPSVTSPKIFVMPLDTVGTIEEKSATAETHQGQTGVWIKSTIGGKQGWLFSGFVLLGSGQDDFISIAQAYSVQGLPS